MANENNAPAASTLTLDTEKVEWPQQSPYATGTFIFTNQLPEVTLVFLRTPLLTDEMVKNALASGGKVVPRFVTSVTINKDRALELAKAIRDIFGVK